MAATADGVYDLETLSDSSLSRLIGSGATTIVVPFGSIERHGAHLPLGADALLADTVGRVTPYSRRRCAPGTPSGTARS